jgi:transposase-like protein
MTKAVMRDPIYRRRRFQSEIIELCVRWYLTYRLSYRDLVEMMAERGVTLCHWTILKVKRHRNNSYGSRTRHTCQ